MVARWAQEHFKYRYMPICQSWPLVLIVNNPNDPFAHTVRQVMGYLVRDDKLVETHAKPLSRKEERGYFKVGWYRALAWAVGAQSRGIHKR